MNGNLLEPRWVRWGLFVGGFTALGLFFASRNYIVYNSYREGSLSWRDALVPSLADWYIWAVLALPILWLARRVPLERGTLSRALPVHLLASLATSALRTGSEFGLGAALGLFGEAPRFLERFFNALHSNLMTYWVIVGGGHLLIYYRKYRERELRASQLEARLAQAQLQVLRMQLHPHFLFNTLHAISTLMHRDVEAADRMIAQLSDLLRVSLASLGVHEVPLKQELEFLERYLEIEQTRFGERLSVHVDIDPQALDGRVPYLILQPIVENAIRHGIAPRAGAGRVEIRAGRAEGILRITVRDDGPGVPKERQARLREGVGLANVRARLQQLYGAGQRFEAENAPEGGFLVSLSIPFRSADEGSAG